ncbi:MAG: hypothetical protein K6F10_02570 [Paludibacteraceae bacterium]|nr:hypothetical protein [Paludibacteraceae bacterium]
MKTINFRKSFVFAFAMAILTICSINVNAQSTTKPSPKAKQSSNYIFLALPSGTVWKITNEEGFYTYEEAQAKFGKQLPTKEQWEELIKCCTWTWTGKGYKVTDKKGASIFLPANGYKSSFGNLMGKDENAFYWARTSKDEEESWGLWMDYNQNKNNIHIFYSKQNYKQSVWLVR